MALCDLFLSVKCQELSHQVHMLCLVELKQLKDWCFSEGCVCCEKFWFLSNPHVLNTTCCSQPLTQTGEEFYPPVEVPCSPLLLQTQHLTFTKRTENFDCCILQKEPFSCGYEAFGLLTSYHVQPYSVHHVNFFGCWNSRKTGPSVFSLEWRKMPRDSQGHREASILVAWMAAWTLH